METALGYAMNAKPGPRKIIKRGRGGRQHNQFCLYKMEEMVLWLNDHLSGAVMGQSITINPSMPSVRGRGLITLILKKATQQRTARLLHQEKNASKMQLEQFWQNAPGAASMDNCAMYPNRGQH